MVQLPAVNTPQFGWCVNKMDKMPEPVPPIFQPEIIAEAIHRISLNPRREVFLGWPSINLAHRGYEGQLTDEPNHHPATNLFEPVPGDHGAHGTVDARARSHDLIARAATVLGAVGVRISIAAGVALAGVALLGGVLAITRQL